MKTAKKDLFTNSDKTKLVEQDDPECAFLVARAGTVVTSEFAHLVTDQEDDDNRLHVFQLQTQVGEKPLDVLLAQQEGSDSTLNEPGTGDDLTPAGVNLQVPNPEPGGPDEKLHLPIEPTHPDDPETSSAVASGTAVELASASGPGPENGEEIGKAAGSAEIEAAGKSNGPAVDASTGTVPQAQPLKPAADKGADKTMNTTDSKENLATGGAEKSVPSAPSTKEVKGPPATKSVKPAADKGADKGGK